MSFEYRLLTIPDVEQAAQVIGEPLQGVVYWIFPKQEETSISLKSLGKLLPLLFTMYPIGYFRAREILKQTDAMHKKHADEPHFYLDNIGVLKSARGKGLSSKLIRPFLEMADTLSKSSGAAHTGNRVKSPP